VPSDQPSRHSVALPDQRDHSTDDEHHGTDRVPSPAVAVNAVVTRSWPLNQPSPPLARFGAVYFDEISAYTTNGLHSLTSGQAITMVDQNNRTLAEPVKLNDTAFQALFVAA
jgi:hypothetical protein